MPKQKLDPPVSISEVKEFLYSFVAVSRHKAVRLSLLCDGTKERRKFLCELLEFKRANGDPEIAIYIAAKQLAAEAAFVLTPIDSLTGEDFLMQIADRAI